MVSKAMIRDIEEPPIWTVLSRHDPHLTDFFGFWQDLVLDDHILIFLFFSSIVSWQKCTGRRP